MLRFCTKVPGIGKKTAIKNLKDQNLPLSSLADTAALLAAVYAKSTKFHHAMVSRMRTTYLNTILSLVKTNRKEININSYYRGLPTQCPTCLLSSLHLEQLSAAKTSGNGPMLGKMSYSKIRVRLVFFWVYIYISLLRKWTLKKKKKMLIGLFFVLLSYFAKSPSLH